MRRRGMGLATRLEPLGFVSLLVAVLYAGAVLALRPVDPRPHVLVLATCCALALASFAADRYLRRRFGCGDLSAFRDLLKTE